MFNEKLTKIEAEKNDKDGIALYKLKKNAVYGKTMESMRIESM